MTEQNQTSSRGGEREGAGRPPIDNPRNVVYQLRLTADERAELEALALVAGMGLEAGVTPSDWLRERIRLAKKPDAATLRAAKAEAKRREAAKAAKRKARP